MGRSRAGMEPGIQEIEGANSIACSKMQVRCKFEFAWSPTRWWLSSIHLQEAIAISMRYAVIVAPCSRQYHRT